jgi:hypothetical protein
MKKLLLAGIAVLSMLYASIAAAVSPWTEADGENTIFLAWKNVTCGTVRYTVWIPYDLAAKKTLDFYRITPTSDTPITTGKITMAGADVFLDGKRCMDEIAKGN